MKQHKQQYRVTAVDQLKGAPVTKGLESDREIITAEYENRARFSSEYNLNPGSAMRWQKRPQSFDTGPTHQQKHLESINPPASSTMRASPQQKSTIEQPEIQGGVYQNQSKEFSPTNAATSSKGSSPPVSNRVLSAPSTKGHKRNLPPTMFNFGSLGDDKTINEATYHSAPIKEEQEE